MNKTPLQLKLVRDIFKPDRTLGNFFADDKFICYTLEDQVRVEGEKVHGKTAIPVGIYKVKLTFSKKFQKVLPEILDVPGFKGVRIHGGNRPEDTLGCPLVGFCRSLMDGIIWKSAENNITKMLADAGGEGTIEIVNKE